VTSGDACVTLDIGGLPVVLVLPERDVELMMWTYRANRILTRRGATMSDAVYLWCGRCGQAIEPEIRDRWHPYCRACRDLPDDVRGHVLSAAMMSLHKEQMCGVPEVPK
jgi:hypothetical protein